MTYCYKSVVAGATYFLGFMGKGGVSCIGQFYTGYNCDGSGLGPEFLNVSYTGTSYWSPSYIASVAAQSTAHSVLIYCSVNGGDPGALDEIFLNQGTSTGF